MSDGFTDEERAAAVARVEELRDSGRGGAKRAKDLEAALDAIEAMEDGDRQLAERLHAVVQRVAPGLRARTWYGFPAYADETGVVCFFTSREKGGARYAVLGFNDAARLDDGELWPTSFAITAWTPAVEETVEDLVRRATDS